jgi:DNA-binding GntR family transcriptional regulator
VGSFKQADPDTMCESNDRFWGAIEKGDVEAALRTEEELHNIPVASDQALAAVLDQFTSVLRRAERLRFSSRGERESFARHDELIRLCAAGDTEQAAALAFDRWHTLRTINDIEEWDTTVSRARKHAGFPYFQITSTAAHSRSNEQS